MTIKGKVMANSKMFSSLCKIVVSSGLMTLSLSAIAQECRTDIVGSTPNSRFEIISNGNEVKDSKTNLVWQRCTIGQSWNGNQCAGNATAMNWKNAMNEAVKAGSNYRVPNIKELQSITEVRCFDPAINISIFPNTPKGPFNVQYWSSTPDMQTKEYIYTMQLKFGLIDAMKKNDNGLGTGGYESRGYVRLIHK